MRASYVLPASAALAFVLLCHAQPVSAAQNDVRQILNKYCVGCHGGTEPQAGVSLISTDTLLAGGDNGAILKPDDLRSSTLFKVLDPEADIPMPPADEDQPTAEERAALRNWILAGAKLSAAALARPDVPDIEPQATRAERLLSSVYLPQKNAVCVSGTQTVRLLDAESHKQLWQVDLNAGDVAQLTGANEKPWLVAACGIPGVGGVGILLSQEDGSVIKQFAGHSDAVYAAVLNHDDSVLATAGYDRKILLHDVETGALLRTLEGHNGSIFDLAFSPDGTVLCSASADGTVKVWRMPDGERLDTLSQPTAEQYAVAVSPDGRFIHAAGADNRIRVWRLVSRQKPRINPLRTAKFAHEQAITTLALSANGARLATAAEDGTLRIWKTRPDLTHLQTMPQQSAVVTSATFLNTSELFVTRIDGTSEVLKISRPKSDDLAPQTTAVNSQPAIRDTAPPAKVAESEPNDDLSAAQSISLPATIAGAIHPNEDAAAEASDTDSFRVSATRGETLLIEVHAERDGSKLDSFVEVVDVDGSRILRTQLQAVRDSYFTFRGKDSDTSDDFRVFNWQEMELNEYLYADGEVVRLWLYPRGPDSGFKVYPGSGNRHTYFGTTATAHALQAPCFIVVPHDPGEPLTDNGLPVFPVYFENDDDPQREWSHDSRLYFTAPQDGDYIVRLTDARGFSGLDHTYQLTVRHPSPDFEVAVTGTKLNVARGTGREMTFTVKRIDGYDGPITINVENLPAGFDTSGPTTIQGEQKAALLAVFATDAATQPTPEQVTAIQFTASANIDNRTVTHELAGLEQLTLQDQPKLRVSIYSSDAAESDTPAEKLVIRPGETVPARLRLERIDHDGIVSFGKEDSGRNLPHGTFVDNIGLNGLLLLEDQSEREFFITAAQWVPEQTRTFYLKSDVDSITSLPVTLEIRSGDQSATTVKEHANQ